MEKGSKKEWQKSGNRKGMRVYIEEPRNLLALGAPLFSSIFSKFSPYIMSPQAEIKILTLFLVVR